MNEKPAYQPSRGDRVGVVIFMIAGAALLIGSGINTALRIMQVLSGESIPVPVQPMGLTVQAPIGPGGTPVPMQVDTATVTVPSLPETAFGAEILGGFALAVVLTAFTIGARLQRDTEGLV